MSINVFHLPDLGEGLTEADILLRAELDALAVKFVEESAAGARQSLLKEAGDLAATLGAGAKHYLRGMEKVVNGSEQYLEKESTRYVVTVSCPLGRLGLLC